MSDYTREQIIEMVAKRESFYGKDLRSAYLSGADLSGAYLSGADLSGADLDGADLDGADLDGADLDGANLDGANLSRAYLSGAYLSGANLSGANLSRAYLSGANLSRAKIGDTGIKRLVARVTRTIESYEFFGYETIDGGCVVVAGCRGPWTTEQFRLHVATNYPDTEKAVETLAILDFIDTRYNATKKK